MPAMELICQIIGINSKNFSKKEKIILEAALFSILYKEINDIFKNDFKNYLNLIKNDFDKEETMIGVNFIRCIIKDILATEIYTLSGIAYYIQTPEEIIYEIATGLNQNPSFELSRKIIALHISVRKNLYKDILQRFAIKSV